VFRRPLWQRYRRQLDGLRDLPINFDLERRDQFTKANGWHIDDYHAELPQEPPGPPTAGGPWDLACAVLREYRFPDPSIVTGIFYPDRPLGERVMLLRARWLIFSFYFGVRVGGVIDGEQAGADGARERVFSYNYQTLKGHIERGQIDFTVAKDLGSGAVSFRIHAFSKADQIRNPLVRFGFRLFGRRLQIRFARRSLARMQRLVQAELLGVGHDHAARPQPAGANPKAARKLDKAADQARTAR
jgi:hypothetical protein